MDSSAYRYFCRDIIQEKNCDISSLPIELTLKDISVSKNSLKAVAFFLRNISSQNLQNCFSIFSHSADETYTNCSFLLMLIRTAHLNISNALTGSECSSGIPFKPNGTELLSFLCNAVSSKRTPLFRKYDSLSYAMCCFLIEAFMYLGWCPNAFENRAKRAAHLYFNLCRKSLWNTNSKEIPGIIGYLQSAWICAQKTEGIKDTYLDSEKQNCINTFSFNTEEGQLIRYNTFSFIKQKLFAIIPESPEYITHLFSKMELEGKTGLFLLSENQLITPIKLLDSKPITRMNINGLQFVYLCKSSKDSYLTWAVIMQVFRSTMYRIDIIRAEKIPCTISQSNFCLENRDSFMQSSENNYYNEKHDFNVCFIENPFCLSYNSQKQECISLFTGRGKTITPGETVKSIIAWTLCSSSTGIDKTNLLGIFDLPNVDIDDPDFNPYK